jgi:prepilin-type N-terminal cleavage/methylation domain-containing protein
MRKAFTLLEMVIAVAILAVVFALTMSTLVGMRHYFSNAATRASLEAEGKMVLMDMAEMLNTSAWVLPGYEEVTQRQKILDSLRGENGDVDRSLLYYPCALGELSHSAFTHWQADHYRADPKEWVEDVSRKRHRGGSQTLVFTMVDRYGPSPTPRTAMPRINFNAASAIPMSDFALDDDALPNLTHLSFSVDPFRRFKTHLSVEQDTQGRLREYCYYLQENDQHDGGQLCLGYAHRNLDTGAVQSVQELRVLSNRVDRFRIDTYRTTMGLAPDQVRITLYMSDVDAHPMRVYHRVEMTVAMRSANGFTETQDIKSNLGIPGAYPVN